MLDLARSGPQTPQFRYARARFVIGGNGVGKCFLTFPVSAIISLYYIIRIESVRQRVHNLSRQTLLSHSRASYVTIFRANIKWAGAILSRSMWIA